jgi:hypothetical protein
MDEIEYGGEVQKLSIETLEQMYAAMLKSPAPGHLVTLTDHEYRWAFGPPRFVLPKKLSRKVRKAKRAKLIAGWYR